MAQLLMTGDPTYLPTFRWIGWYCVAGPQKAIRGFVDAYYGYAAEPTLPEPSGEYSWDFGIHGVPNRYRISSETPSRWVVTSIPRNEPVPYAWPEGLRPD